VLRWLIGTWAKLPTSSIYFSFHLLLFVTLFPFPFLKYFYHIPTTYFYPLSSPYQSIPNRSELPLLFNPVFKAQLS
jgi:hypothetical protein